jgi:hypothetical protein
MTETDGGPRYTLGPNDKVTQVMVYTASAFYWGEVVVKEMVRVSTWLRTNTAPDRICLYNAHAILLSAGAGVKPMAFGELHVATTQVIMFHIQPPAKDPPDYDPTEPNRKMQPLSLLVGSFRVDGSLRISTHATIGKFLEVTREAFTSVYDARVTSPSLPGFGAISVPYLLVRQEVAVFTV